MKKQYLLYLIIGLMLLGSGLSGYGQSEVPTSRNEQKFRLEVEDVPSFSSSRKTSIQSNGNGIRTLKSYLVPSTEVELEGKPNLIGWFVVQITMDPEFHLYSMNSQASSFPTRITIDIPPLPNTKETIIAGDFLTASPIYFSEFMGSPLEEMKGVIYWLAPLYLDSVHSISPEERVKLLQETSISATITALSCREGEGGTCNRIDRKLSPHYETSLKITPLLEKSQEIEVDRLARQKPTEMMETAITMSKKGDSVLPFTFWTFLSAFFGGLLLNVMPCVLPVIGLKIVSFFQQADQSRSKALWLNGWYTLGILTVFLVLALMSVGLSYLFTYGLFQIVMGAIVFAMALNLMGIWEIQLPAFLGGKKSNELMEKGGSIGAFFKGIITTLLAIPCGAPLLSPALVWADTMIKQNQTFLVILVYLVIGLGMASPYLLLGAFPELLRFLPKPGIWMETFRNIMGFILLTAVIWILFSMPLILVIPMISFLFALWFACWYIGRIPWDAKKVYRWRIWSISFVVLIVVVFFSFNIRGINNPYTLENAVQDKMIRWSIRAEREGLLRQDSWGLFDLARFEKLQKEGKPIIIDFTADWCLNCKTLEATILHTTEIEELLAKKGFVTMTADMTTQNVQTKEMNALNTFLDQYGGRQVPTIMIFDPKRGQEPVILRGLFSKNTFLETIE